MFSSILGSAATMSQVAVCFSASLVCGLLCAFTYRYCENTSKNFLTALAVLPAIVMMVILMVNGNLGVGVAVAGSFSLVRFRSLPGRASDIVIIFLAMGLGLCTGMGYVYFALASAVIMCLLYVLISKLPLLSENTAYRSIRITIPEDLEYTEVFADIFNKYTSKAEEHAVRTINLGTMYQVTYDVVLKNTADEKQMIDEIRVRNGNLPVICGRAATAAAEL